MGGWWSYFAFFACLILALTSAQGMARADLFDAEAQETAGTVLDQRIEVSYDSDGDETRSYILTVRFELRDGTPIQVDKSVGSERYHTHPVTSRIPLWYLASAPDVIEFERGETRANAEIVRILAYVAGVIGIGLAAWPLRRLWSARQARRRGTPEVVSVGGHAQTRYTVNDRYRYRLTWTDSLGRSGQSLAYDKSALMEYPPGSEITVFVGKDRSWWAGDTGGPRL